MTIDYHAALIYTMVLVSAADREMSDDELEQMANVIGPTFQTLEELQDTLRVSGSGTTLTG